MKILLRGWTLIITLISVQCGGCEPGLSGYTVKAGPWQSEYRIMSVFVLPGHQFNFRVERQGIAVQYDMAVEESPLFKHVKESQWRAPDSPGMVRIRFFPKSQSVGESLEPADVLVFVMHPETQVVKGKLNGYTIGAYPKEPLNGLAIYEPPQGFVEVTPENQDTFISPHYQLKQFLCKQNQGFPKYVVLQTRLLRKLEFLTQVVNARGIATDGFVIMSGYRTPFYNTAINNKKYSRHQWGGAADIYVDEKPRDGIMDDLNKDGKVDVEDARVLWTIVESHFKESSYKPMIGGLGLYKANAAHGPFIHVDVRGFRARW